MSYILMGADYFFGMPAILKTDRIMPPGILIGRTAFCPMMKTYARSSQVRLKTPIFLFIKTSILAGLLMLYTVLSPFKGDPLLIPLRVTLPLSIPGIISGITMVFLPSITTFAISLMLGSGKVYLAGDMIEEYFITLNNRPIGSSISMVMLVLMLVSMGFLRMVNPDRNQKGGSVW